MSQDTSFTDLMARLRAGDEDAARRIIGQFAQRLVALARSRLGQRVRQKVDPEDVLQSVYKSFFLRHAQGQLTPETWDSLWAVLTVITLRKCGRWVEHFHTAKRRLGAEVAGADAGDDSWQAVAREPTPEEAAMLTETVEDLLRGLEGRERAMVALALQGASVAEIAKEVGRTRRTVQRVLARVKDRLERQRAEGSI